jgi:hypothetical protein
MTLQTPLPTEYLHGDITVKMVDPASPATVPYVIRRAMPFDVVVDWYLDGQVANLIGPADARWHLHVMAHAVDGGPEPAPNLLADVLLPLSDELDPKPDRPREYRSTTRIPAGTLREGLFQIVAFIKYDNGAGLFYGMAGFAETPIFEIVESEVEA